MPREWSSAWARLKAASKFARRGGGQQRFDQADRALLQHSGRLAAGVAFDPAADRVRSVPGDPGQFQSTGVDPGAVVVPVRQEHGPVLDHGVEGGRSRQTAGERLQRPAATGDPRVLRVGTGVVADRRQVLLRALERAEIAPAQFKSAEDRVDVGVLEAGDEQPPGQVDPLGPRAGQVPGPRADREDPAVPDRHRLADRPGRAVGGEHRPVVEEQVRLGSAGRRVLHSAAIAVSAGLNRFWVASGMSPMLEPPGAK